MCFLMAMSLLNYSLKEILRFTQKMNWISVLKFGFNY